LRRVDGSIENDASPYRLRRPRVRRAGEYPAAIFTLAERVDSELSTLPCTDDAQ
jgi:hypothetical protein